MMGRVLLLTLMVALTATTVTSVAHADTTDPWEGINRKTFAVNDFFDRILLKPVARGYTKVVPKFLRQGVHNALVNIGTPVVALNQLLQGKGRDAASDTGRFLVNSTLGLGGFFDPANGIGLKAHNEDFGQTFQVWGIGRGRHIVLPLSGSTTVTDGIGSIVGGFVNPLSLLSNDVQSSVIVRVVGVVDLRSELLSAESLISGDRYLFLRDAILQRRQFLVHDGELEEDAFLTDDEFDYDEEGDDEDWGEDEP